MSHTKQQGLIMVTIVVHPIDQMLLHCKGISNGLNCEIGLVRNLVSESSSAKPTFSYSSLAFPQSSESCSGVSRGVFLVQYIHQQMCMLPGTAYLFWRLTCQCDRQASDAS